jgi:hypothetical protein
MSDPEYEWDTDVYSVYDAKLFNDKDPKRVDDVRIIALYKHSEMAMLKLQGYEIREYKHCKTQAAIENFRSAIAIVMFF